MDIKLNEILKLTTEEIENSRIELNMTEGSGGIAYIDKWLTLEQSIKDSGISECSYWGWYGNKKNFNVGQTVFSFLKMSNDEWLFVSAAKILDVPCNSRANVKILEKYKSFFGRLVMKYKKGNTFARYVFRMNGIIENCIVKEILSCQYNGEQFEGYDRINLPYGKLADIFSGKIMPTYYEALKKVTGIYCLTDTKTGKLYIGSATGVEGVAQRWGNYLSSKHGGNAKLLKLYNQKGDEYFEKYFNYSLIEYFGLSYDPQKIKEREQYWKRCFSTIADGYNDN